MGAPRGLRALLADADDSDSIQTVTAITILFLALVIYPEVQKKAQAELDAVVGRDRLPTFDDRPRLPYIEAICREVARWHVTEPMGSIIPPSYEKREINDVSLTGVPHASCEDDVYRGFFIPKGLFGRSVLR